MQIRVDCYAGYRGEETPRRFHLGFRQVEVQEVLDRWLSPEIRYFKVRGDDGALYILCHDTESDRWSLSLFDRRPAPTPQAAPTGRL